MKMRLEWQIGEEVHQREVNDERPCLVGRLPKCDIVLDDETVSREQAVITADHFVFMLRNVSGANPITLADGSSLKSGQSIRMRAGHRYKLGNVHLYVVEIETAVDQVKIKCPSCERVVKATLLDCPWCGSSLAGAGTAVVQ